MLFQVVTQFDSVFPLYTGGIHIIKLLFSSSLYCAVLRHSVLPDSVTPWTVAPYASLSMGIL